MHWTNRVWNQSPVLLFAVAFMEDLRNRECAQFLRENTAAKWFCGFTLSEPTPDYSLMCRVRKRIGTKRLSTLFSVMRKLLSQHGMMSEVFTFVDATHLITKANLWEGRDVLLRLCNKRRLIPTAQEFDVLCFPRGI